MLDFFKALFIAAIAGAIAYGIHPFIPGIGRSVGEQNKPDIGAYARFPDIQRFLASPAGNALLRESGDADAAVLQAERAIASLSRSDSRHQAAVKNYLDAGLKQLDVTQKISKEYIKWAKTNDTNTYAAPSEQDEISDLKELISIIKQFFSERRWFSLLIAFDVFFLLFFARFLFPRFLSGWRRGERRIVLPGGVPLYLLRVPVEEGERPFWLGECEVTQAQWEAVMGADANPSEHKGDKFPVANITHKEVVEFCRRVTKREYDKKRLKGRLQGYSYTLPKEREWLLAASAKHSHAWYVKVWSAIHSWRSGNNSPNKPRKVAQTLPNDLGFYDIADNVSEMCADSANGNTSGAPCVVQGYVYVGGSFTTNPDGEETFKYRSFIGDNERSSAIGFRLALRWTDFHSGEADIPQPITLPKKETADSPDESAAPSATLAVVSSSPVKTQPRVSAAPANSRPRKNSVYNAYGPAEIRAKFALLFVIWMNFFMLLLGDKIDGEFSEDWIITLFSSLAPAGGIGTFMLTYCRGFWSPKMEKFSRVACGFWFVPLFSLVATFFFPNRIYHFSAIVTCAILFIFLVRSKENPE